MVELKLILATIFDYFKIKSPVIAATVLAVLSLIAYNFDAIANDFGITNPTFLAAAKWVNIIFMALTGSRTSQILEQKKEDLPQA